MKMNEKYKNNLIQKKNYKNEHGSTWGWLKDKIFIFSWTILLEITNLSFVTIRLNIHRYTYICKTFNLK